MSRVSVERNQRPAIVTAVNNTVSRFNPRFISLDRNRGIRESSTSTLGLNTKLGDERLFLSIFKIFCKPHSGYFVTEVSTLIFGYKILQIN